MQITRAVEDYLKVIYNLQHPPGGAAEPVTTSRVAQRLGVSAASVSAMLKRLEVEGFVHRQRSSGVTLSPLGERAALRMVRRHRLLETLLHRQLGVPWDEVHEEAERLEHALSDRLEAYIDTALGHPTHDPHGDPIPGPDGREASTRQLSLGAAPAGSRFAVRRVSDADAAALRYLGEHGIVPGATLTVVEHAAFGGPTWVSIEERPTPYPLAAQLTGMIFGDVVGAGD